MTEPSPAVTRSPAGRDPSLARTLWFAIYIVILLSPLVLMFAGADSFRRPAIVEFSVALGFVAMTALVLQVVIPSRASAFSTPFGIDVLLRFHREMGIAAAVLVVAHVVILMVNNPDLLHLLDPIEAPWRARAGGASLLALLLLIATSIWRARARLTYEGWRAVHLGLGLAVLAFALWHLAGVGHYFALDSIRVLALVAVVVGCIAIFYLRVARPWVLSGRPYRVAEVKRERGGATTLELIPVGHDGIAFRPGQFAWLKFRGRPYALSENPFSFSSSALRLDRVAMTVKARGDFTTAVVPEVSVGTEVLLDGPHGSFRAAWPDAPFLLIAAGIGITPVMSILRTLADAEDTRELWLFYASRRWEEVTFREELQELEQRLNLTTVFVLSQPQEGWGGETGRIEADLLERSLPLRVRQANIFFCGPPAMGDAVLEELASLGLSGEQIHVERFVSV